MQTEEALGIDIEGLPPEQQKAIREQLIKLSNLRRLLNEKEREFTPESFGLPVLDFKREPQESEEAFKTRQDKAIRDFVEGRLYTIKDGVKSPIRLIDEMVRLISDIFYSRVNFAILWKPRGGGGSVCASVIIWLMMIYRRYSFMNLGGSDAQAKVIYEHVKQLWSCVPKIEQNLLADDPMVSETKLKTGVVLKCVPCSEKQTRSKHYRGMILDEACQSASATDDVMIAAMQGTMTQPGAVILLLSTFHLPSGMFQDHWDHAEDKGFARYKWTCYDAMEACTEGLSCATKDDPKFFEFCMTKCPLTREVDEFDEEGKFLGKKLIGCQGKARDSRGFITYQQMLLAYKANKGTRVFEIEYEGERPDWGSVVYGSDEVDASMTDLSAIRLDAKLGIAVGIDWGLVGQTAVIVGGLSPEGYLLVPECRFFSGQGSNAIIKYLVDLQSKYGSFMVYADASHPFENLEVEQSNFDISRVPFQKWKPFGVQNLVRFFMNHKIRVSSNETVLLRQLKSLRRDKGGNIIKKDDHGPDALMCLGLHFWYTDIFGSDGFSGPTGGPVSKPVLLI